MDSARVHQRLKAALQTARDLPSDAVPLVRSELGGRPGRGSLPAALATKKASVAIPNDIVSLERRDAAIAWEWRLATRWAFTESLKAGFIVSDYYRPTAGQSTGSYLLESGNLADFLSGS